MSHSPVREDKTCLNCGSRVENLYCPQCGQQNTTTRQPFYFLITHFVEDFLHYDGGFLNTMKRLFFRPGQLTLDYLAGKRNGQVNPVKLYIFVSFVTFFIISFVPSSSNKPVLTATTSDKEAAHIIIDSLRQDPIVAQGLKDFKLPRVDTSGTIELDLQNSEDHPAIFDPLAHKINSLIKKGWTADEVKTAFVAKYVYYFPKVLFLYLPIFAFVVWLFYDKRKFWYFDHGIFTLHYLTMSLISICLIYLLASLRSTLHNVPNLHAVLRFIQMVFLLNMILNFYLSLYHCYKQSITRTLLKGTGVMLINMSLLFIIMLGVLVASFLNL